MNFGSMDDRLSAQIDKLAHELDEIRVRALTSILSKLDLGIIREKDLISKSDIFVKLLDWFNFPVIPCKRDVLKLISRLVKERDGAFYLHIIDPGLENLKKAAGNEFNEELKEIKELIELSDDYIPSGGPNLDRECHRTILSQEESLSRSENAVSLSASSDRSKEWLYSEIYWPVPRLDDSDSRVLASVGSLLSDRSQYAQAANFFSTVLLHDFPPQVFLQDTSILNGLFNLFEEGGNHQYVVSCFKEFTLSLFRQFRFYEDPASIEMVCHVSKDGDDTALCEWADPGEHYLSEQLSFLSKIVKAHPTLVLSLLLSVYISMSCRSTCPMKVYENVQGLSKLFSLLVVQLSGWFEPGLGLIPGVTDNKQGVGEYCALSLEKLGNVVPGALHLLRLCIKDPPRFWDSTSGTFLKTCISNHLVLLATKIKSSRISDPLTRLETQVWICQVLSSLIPVHVSSSIVHQHLQSVLAEELYDPCLFLFYPRVHEEFNKYVSKFKYLENINHEEVDILAQSLKAVGKFMAEGEDLPMMEALDCFYTGLTSLDIHHETGIIKVLFKIIINRQLTPGEEELAEKVLLSLMSHMEITVQEETYSEFSQIVTNILGPPAAVNNNRAEFDKIKFMLSPIILKEVVNFGLMSSSSKVVKTAETILILVLKGKLLLSGDQWSFLLVSINICMPLLLALASNYTSLGRCVLQMYDPDVAADMSFHPLQVVSGNVRLLFSADSVIAAEGYARLIYLLGISPETTFSMPDSSLHIPQPSAPINVFNEDNIPRLIEVLRTTDGKMLKSAVIQVSLISEQPSLHVPLLDAGVLSILLHILNSSLENLTEYTPEYYSSIIVVLKNLALHNIQLRNDFSSNYEMYTSILKGLFMIPGERRWISDALQLLVLMVYSELILYKDGILSLPPILVNNLKFPFHIRAYGSSSNFTLPSMKFVLVGRQDICQYLGAIWCFTLSGGQGNFITKFNNLSPPHPLELPPKKCFILLGFELEKSLIDLKVATSHQAATNALQLIQRLIKLICWSDDKKSLEELPWEKSFKRYLMTVPASPADQLLLVEILRVLGHLIRVFPSQVEWVSKFVRDPSNMLSTLLTQTTVEDCTSLKKELSLELLALVEKCVTLTGSVDWEPVAIILLQSLNYSHTQKFYSLAIVDRLLGCLVRLSKGISVPGSEGPLWKLLSAFHCPSKTSFMGLTITRRALFALNSIIAASKDFKIPEEAVWISKLLCSRDSLVVGAALELSSRLSRTTNNLNKLLNHLPDLWDSAIRILLDHRQSSLVREHAAFLCCNIVNNSQNKAYVSDSIEKGLFECFAQIFSRKNERIKPEEIFIHHTNNSSDLSESSMYSSGVTTGRLITYICCLTAALMMRDQKKIVSAASSTGFISSLARDVSSWQCEKLTDGETVEMFEAILRILVYAYSEPSTGSFLTDALHTLLWLLLPSTYGEGISHSGLIKETLRLLSLVASGPAAKIELVIPGEAVTSICSAITSQDPAMCAAAASAVPPIAPFLSQGACIELIEAIGCRDSMRAALASVVGNSHSASLIAIDIGILKDCIYRLKTAQLSLALAPRNSKKAMLIFEELGTELIVVTNLVAGCNVAKEEAATLGLADAMHKLWYWTITDCNLLSASLRALITFTANSSTAAATLVLTSTLVGVGQRKSPTSSSLLHAILGCLPKEVFSTSIKNLFLQLLSHASQAPECRNVIAKSNYLLEFLNVHAQKKAPCVDEMEALWLEFLCVFTSFPDGQASLIKNEEVIENLLDYMCGNRGAKHRSPALRIIRNLIFNPANRQKFILSEKVLGSVSDRLTDIKLSDEELQDVLLIAWSLSANSQRGKGSVRSSGLASRLDAALILQSRSQNIQQLVDIVLPIVNS